MACLTAADVSGKTVAAYHFGAFPDYCLNRPDPSGLDDSRKVVRRFVEQLASV